MTFLGDERAQAVQIGAVLLFGLLIIGLTIHQIVVLPDQNREVEFNHFTDAQDDLEELRNAVIKAGQTGTAVPVGVKLGTAYPARLLSIQAPAATGRLRTAVIGDSGTAIELRNTDANMSDICGLGSLSTRRAAYQPSYNYLSSAGNISYENTAVYTNAQSGGRYVQTDQQLIVNETIHVYPLLGEYSRSGQGVESLTLRGGETGVNGSVPGPLSLVIPTRLSVANWQDLLSDEHTVSEAGQHAVEVELAGGESYDIRCSPVGVGFTPDNDPAVTDDEGGNGGTAEGNTSINPNFGNDVVLRDVYETGSDGSLSANQVRLELENTSPDSYQNITHLRFPFFASGGQGNVAELSESFEYQTTIVERLGPYQQISRRDIPPGERVNVTLSFYCGNTGSGSGSFDLADGDLFVIDALFENVGGRTYFVALQDSGSSGGRCNSGNQNGGPPGNGGGGGAGGSNPGGPGN